VTASFDPVLSAFYDTGANLRGHFRLTSGLHSPEYLQCALVLDRSGGAVDLGVPRVALKTLEVVAYSPDDCPLCRAGSPVVKPGSRPISARPAR
jgi:orotate phosphoribosyltransferase